MTTSQNTRYYAPIASDRTLETRLTQSACLCECVCAEVWMHLLLTLCSITENTFCTVFSSRLPLLLDLLTFVQTFVCVHERLHSTQCYIIWEKTQQKSNEHLKKKKKTTSEGKNAFHCADVRYDGGGGGGPMANTSLFICAFNQYEFRYFNFSLKHWTNERTLGNWIAAKANRRSEMEWAGEREGDACAMHPGLFICAPVPLPAANTEREKKNSKQQQHQHSIDERWQQRQWCIHCPFLSILFYFIKRQTTTFSALNLRIYHHHSNATK